MCSSATTMILLVAALLALAPVSARLDPNSTSSNSSDVCVPEVNPRRYDFLRCVQIVNTNVTVFDSDCVLIECERDFSVNKDSASYSMNSISGYLHCIEYDSTYGISTTWKNFGKLTSHTTFACTEDNQPFDAPVCALTYMKFAFIAIGIAVPLMISLACFCICKMKKNTIAPSNSM